MTDGTEMQSSHGYLSGFLRKIAQARPDRDHILFVCIGTDRSTGDSFGPIMGTLLKKAGWKHVIGCLEEPCDAYAVEAALAAALELQESGNLIVIAIDACLGPSVGEFIVSKGSLQPGAATGRRLPPIGDYSIAAVVNQNGPKAYIKLQTTSLNHVYLMAKKLLRHIQEAWSISSCGIARTEERG
ncbi:spore protease YyaC [Paenibacillus sp. HB172176]|uniref:spore protease YyaC n=1 Tax=Paenibacillus sp. HB172176 TaxID=2493690 RepID=UPI001438C861|nr:spore protease YyaC [Paenibacillus sp. HB172176]